MQAVINTTQYPDLYRFLAALLEATVSSESSTSAQAESVIIWSPEARSTLLDSPEKIELVEHYAKKLEVQIALSAAADHQLRTWGQEIGWTVLWDMPAIDRNSNDAWMHNSTPTKDLQRIA